MDGGGGFDHGDRHDKEDTTKAAEEVAEAAGEESADFADPGTRVHSRMAGTNVRHSHMAGTTVMSCTAGWRILISCTTAWQVIKWYEC